MVRVEDINSKPKVQCQMSKSKCQMNVKVQNWILKQVQNDSKRIVLIFCHPELVSGSGLWDVL
jgi:hypothetical protein